MNTRRAARIGLAVLTIAVLLGGIGVAAKVLDGGKQSFTAYFENSNGIFPGDDVKILGVPVGKIDSIEPQPQRAKIRFSISRKYKVPVDAKAVILSPTVVTARFIQLTPAYIGGPNLPENAVIPQTRTAVPVEWDDLRDQLQKMNSMLEPTQPGGVSTLGAFVSTVADNLRGQGPDIRDSVIKLSQSLSILGDKSGDIFGTIKNLAIMVSALHDSTDLMRALNQNLAAVTGLLSNDHNEVGTAVVDLNEAVTDVRGFVADNRESLGTTFDKLAAITEALSESIPDLKETLHGVPTTLANYDNIYEPAAAANTGALAGNNFANPIQFICGAIQAASRLNAEQSAKLCVQYLAPIVKNRQYNFLGPIGLNGSPLLPFLPVGAQARPNEVTFSEDWMRPDFVPPAPAADAALPGPAGSSAATSAPMAAEAQDNGLPPASPPNIPTDPAAGLPGLMMPAGAGS